MELNTDAGLATPGSEVVRPNLPPDYADLPAMKAWAAKVMERPHDFTIGNDYIRRWYIVPRNEHFNIYLHHILHSDDDRALHDHPWPNTSWLISGCYVEHTPDGMHMRKAGDVVMRPATALHRLELPTGKQAVSLFITGPKAREWGFDCPQGWKHWADFTDPSNPGRTGPGCGE